MEDTGEDDDLAVLKASASLLSDLEASLPRVLYKTPKLGTSRGAIHCRVRQRDLDHLVKLVCSPSRGCVLALICCSR